MSLSPNLERQPQEISYQESGGGGKLQVVNSDTMEAAYCDHFGMDIS